MKENMLMPVAAWLCAACLFGCGTKPPEVEVKPPAPALPESRECYEPMAGPNMLITSELGESNGPVLAWAGETFALAWWDLRGTSPAVYMLRVDADGTRRSGEKRISGPDEARDQDVAYDGEETHIVWNEGGRIMSLRLGPQGGEPVTLAANGRFPAAGPWGAAAWAEQGGLYFRCDGVPAGTKPSLVSTGGIEDARIAWAGDEYAVVWSGSVKGGRDILLKHVTPKGRPFGKPVRISSPGEMSRRPQVVWTGESFALAWTIQLPDADTSKDKYRISFAVVPQKGAAPVFTRALEFTSAVDRIALAASGKDFGLAWVGTVETKNGIFFARLDLSGNPIGRPIKVSDDTPQSCGRPSLAWGGDGYALAWSDDRQTTGSEVIFSYLTCGEAPPLPAAPAADAGPATEPSPAADAGTGAAKAPVLKDVFEDKKGHKGKKDKAEPKAEPKPKNKAPAEAKKK
ncbi:MAG: hypothetical protein PHU25_16075 [Deltaproteobacteria bacterium]|nr:hypothetical protein [Deltaproteobacteria bacterium]